MVYSSGNYYEGEWVADKVWNFILYYFIFDFVVSFDVFIIIYFLFLLCKCSLLHLFYSYLISVRTIINIITNIFHIIICNIDIHPPYYSTHLLFQKCGRGVMNWVRLDETYLGDWEDDAPHGLGEHIWGNFTVFKYIVIWIFYSEFLNEGDSTSLSLLPLLFLFWFLLSLLPPSSGLPCGLGSISGACAPSIGGGGTKGISYIYSSNNSDNNSDSNNNNNSNNSSTISVIKERNSGEIILT